MKKLSQTPWETLSTTPIYGNKWLSLREDLAEIPDGWTKPRSSLSVST